MRWKIAGGRFFRGEYLNKPLPDGLECYREMDNGGNIHWGYHIEYGFVLLISDGSEGSMRIYIPHKLDWTWAQTLHIFVLGNSSFKSAKEVVNHFNLLGSPYYWARD